MSSLAIAVVHSLSDISHSTADDHSDFKVTLPSTRVEEVEQQEESLPTDLAAPSQELSPSSTTEHGIPKKIAASEKEVCFSTATLLKDGKLYCQVIWNQFSDLGSQSDLFEPVQFLSGVHHPLVLSQADPRKQHQVTESTATAILRRKQSSSNSQTMASMTAANPCSHSLDLLGQHLGQASRNRMVTTTMTTSMSQDQALSPDQMAAAIQVAQENFIALARDPKVLELMEMSANRTVQPVMINSGTFTERSVQSQMDPSLVTTSKTISRQLSKRQQQMYPNPDFSLNSSFKSIPSIKISADGDRPLLTSPAAAETERSTSSRTTKQLGSVSVRGGGGGSFVSSSSGPQRLHKRSESKSSSIASGGALTGAKKGKRLFGKKSFKWVKKSGFFAAITGGSDNGRKRKPLLNLGIRRQDKMTKTVESMDEVFPWMCIEHMTGEESDWVMLEPVQDGAVGWVLVEKLKDDGASEVL